VRITAVESLINQIIMPSLSEFQESHPNIELSLIGSSENLGIDRFEADIAVRLARPTSGAMTIRKLADIGFSVYHHRSHNDKAPDTDAPVWAVYDKIYEDLPEMKWIRTNCPDAHIGLRCPSAASILNAVLHTKMSGILPCFMGDAHPDLIRLSGEKPILYREAWIATHPDLYQTQRIQAGFDWLKATFFAQQKRLRGFRS
jgi:DNA-binding transcriptional LysR family regulator